LPQVGDAAKNVLGSLGAEARQLGQPSVAGRRLQLRQRVDVEQIVNLADLGDAKPGNGEHLDQSRRDLLPQVLEHGRTPGRGQLADDLEGAGPDAASAGQRAVLERLPKVAWNASERPGGCPERPDPKWVVSLELHE